MDIKSNAAVGSIGVLARDLSRYWVPGEVENPDDEEEDCEDDYQCVVYFWQVGSHGGADYQWSVYFRKVGSRGEDDFHCVVYLVDVVRTTMTVLSTFGR